MGTNGLPRGVGESDDTRGVLDAIRRIVQVLRSTAVQAERQAGLSAAQLFVLQKLGDGATISVNDLAARTHTHQSSVSVVVQRLVDQRLVRRQRSPSDGRRADVTITAAGLRKLRIAPQAAQDRLIESLQRMPAGDRRRLAALLNQFVNGADAANAAVPELFFENDNRRRTPTTSKGTRRSDVRKRD
jgi:DNA-binding MarR family transcriptional regulator